MMAGETNGAAAPPTSAAPAASADAGAAPATNPALQAPVVPDLKSILEFDPFEPTGSDGAEKPGTQTPGSTATPTPSADGKPGTTPGAPQIAAGQNQPPAPGATPGTTPGAPATSATETQSLQDMFAAHTAAIREAISGAQPSAPAKPAEPPAPKFNLGIPPKILEGMRSEDPAEFGASMHALVNGIANHIWNTVGEYLQGDYSRNIMSQVESGAQARTVQQSVHGDFYGTHKNLANPLLAPMVQQAGIMVARERMQAGKSVAWGPELRDEIAEKIYAVFPQLKAVAAAGLSPPPPPPPPVRPQHFIAGGGTRPAPSAAGNAQQQEMQDLLTG